MFIVQSVVGVSFENRGEAIKHLLPGDHVLLILEDHNPHDRNAIAVQDLHGQSLGHIARSNNVRVRQHMARYGNVATVYEIGAPPFHRYLSLKILLPGATAHK